MENTEIENSLPLIENLFNPEKAEQSRTLFEQLDEQNTPAFLFVERKN